MHYYKKKSLVALVLFFVFLSAGPISSRNMAGKKVLLLHSYHHGFFWTDGINRVLSRNIKDAFPNTKLYIEYMDTKRHSPRFLNQQLFLLYKKKYRLVKLDAIVCSDDNAFRFLLKYRALLFPGVPIVFCGVNQFKDSMIAGQKGITGVVEAYDLKGLTETVLTIHKNLKYLVVVNDGTPSGISHRNNFEKIAKKLSRQVVIVRLYNLTKKELQKRIRQLAPQSAVLLFSLYRTKDGVVFTNDEIAKFFIKYCKYPYYSAWDSMFQAKVVGGYMVSSRQQGKKAAEKLIALLEGKPFSSLPVLKRSPNQLVFDYYMLQHFKIPVSELPAGSVVLNRPASFYQKYSTLIWSVVLVLVIQTTLLIFLSMNISRRKKAEEVIMELNRQLEIRVQRRTSALQQSLEELKSTQTKLIESEKLASLGSLVSGVAHEVNTPIGVCITAASFLQDSVADFKASSKEKIDPELLDTFLRSAEDSSRLVVTNLKRASRLVKSFKQLSVDHSNEEKREFYVKEYLQQVMVSLQPQLKKGNHNIIIECAQDTKAYTYPSALAQIITNLVMNSLMHGFGEKEECTIKIKIITSGTELVVMYSDNGKGIPEKFRARIFEPFFTTKMGQECTGLGLNVVYNLITKKMMGRVSFRSRMNKGTCFRIVFPIRLTSL